MESMILDLARRARKTWRAAAPRRRRSCRLFEKGLDGAGDLGGVAGLHEQGRDAVLEEFRNGADRGGDNGQAGGGRLKNHERKVFITAWQKKDGGFPVKPRFLFAPDARFDVNGFGQ